MTWNNVHDLEQTIRSAIEQTYLNYKYIVIDGDSSDGSKNVLAKYKDKLTYAISEPDSGIYNAMNKGIRKATGDYCYFLNSGDIFASKDTLMHIFSKNTYDAPFICGHQINLINGEKQLVKAKNRNLSLYDFYRGTIKHQAIFIKRTLFDKYGLYDESLKITSDWKFFLQTIDLNNEQPVYVDIDIVHFLWDGISTSPSTKEIHDIERKMVIDEFIPKSLQADYELLHNLHNYTYIIDLMQQNRLFAKIVKGLVKLSSS